MSFYYKNTSLKVVSRSTAIGGCLPENALCCKNMSLKGGEFLSLNICGCRVLKTFCYRSMSLKVARYSRTGQWLPTVEDVLL